ncbi:MFS transporter [Undibacterium sp. Di24W]|uniref:MFS transporter n=1 Tax=Undibacterium sp. Di24W TaxID=3413033 RepID=UPI003BF01F36
MLSISQTIESDSNTEIRHKSIRRAMLFGGFSSFSMLYCVQPLMPMLASEFALSAAQSSWILSISTLCLAFSLVVSSVISEVIGRKKLMLCAVTIAAVMTMFCSLVHSFEQLIVLRGLLGVALGGMPAVAIAYLSEEVEASALASAIGLYIAGSALGGMSGRLINALLCDFFSWQAAFAIMGSIGLYSAWEFWRTLPDARHFKSDDAITLSQLPTKLTAVMAGFRSHALNHDLLRLFGLAFILTGCFTSFYNYISFHLIAAPFHFSQASLGAISIFYLLGMISSILAGNLIAKFGRRKLVLGALCGMLFALLLTLSASIALVIAGTAVFTFSFFLAHSVASSWVARLALSSRALASAMYLFCYYTGASLLGSIAGSVWSGFAWTGLIFFMSSLLLFGAYLTLRLYKIE